MLAELTEFLIVLLNLVRWIAGISSVILIAGGLYFAHKSGFWKSKIWDIYVNYRKKPTAETASTQAGWQATKEWKKIQDRLQAGDEAAWKLSVIEADKLVDTALKEAGIPGQTMGERMKSLTEARLPSIDDLWRVHRLRNHLVHTADFHISSGQAKRAINIYEKVLKELKAL